MSSRHNEHESDAFSLQSFNLDERSSFTTVRESIEYAVPDKTGCDVVIFDEGTQSNKQQGTTSFKTSLPCDRSSQLPDDLKSRLAQGDDQLTRWINFTGWSSPLVKLLSEQFLDNHGCLDLHNIGDHAIGGPIKCEDGSHFIWIQNAIWFVGQKPQIWSTVQQCSFKMVIKLPTPSKAGTIITTFSGKKEVVERVSQALTFSLLDDHSMGAEAMSCVWVLAGSIMRAIIDQLGRAFENFDPLDRVHPLPDMTRLPFMLHQANELARIDRYTSGLLETLVFFDAVRDFQQTQECSNPMTIAGPKKCMSRISDRSRLESTLSRHKIDHAQQLCRTYIKQYESHMQMMLSYSTARIAEKLESGSRFGEKIAAVGIILAAITCLTSPLAIVTSYFGMNLDMLVEGGQSTQFDFWSVALAVVALSISVLGILLHRLFSIYKR